MDPMLPIAGLTVGVAVAVALLAWAAFDIGVRGLERYRESFTERARFSLREMFVFVEPGRLFALNLGMLLLAGSLGWLLSGSWLLALGIVALAAFIPRLVLALLRARRRRALEQQLPDALLTIAGGMKSGVSLGRAIQQVALEAGPPVSQEFDLVLREQRLGVSLDAALEKLEQRLSLPSVTLAVCAMRIATETGGHLAETLERTSRTLREKLAMEGKIRALTSQGKLQAWVVGALPLFLLVVLRRMEPQAMDLMFSTQTGWATLVVIGLLECFGVLVIRRIVRIDV